MLAITTIPPIYILPSPIHKVRWWNLIVTAYGVILDPTPPLCMTMNGDKVCWWLLIFQSLGMITGIKFCMRLVKW